MPFCGFLFKSFNLLSIIDNQTCHFGISAVCLQFKSYVNNLICGATFLLSNDLQRHTYVITQGNIFIHRHAGVC